MSKENNNVFDSTNLLLFLLKWRKHIVIICAIAAIGSAGVSLIITEKFRSSVVLFPASTSSVSKALIADNNSGKYDVLSFGEEEQAEQMLQVLNSDEIRDKITKKYNLLEHYNIKPEEKYANTTLVETYQDNIGFRRTKYQSVEIEVMDTDPQMAANIANDIANLLDSVMNRMQKERAIKALNIVEKEYKEMEDHMQMMKDSLTVLRKLGINDYESQSEMYNQEYSKAISQGNTRAIKALEEKLSILAEYGSAYTSLTMGMDYQQERIANLRMKYKEARVDAYAQIPHKFVVNRAFAAEKKAYPVRWLIVVVSTFSAFLMSILLIIGLENYREIKDKI